MNGTHAMARTGRRHGFSLMELMVVIAILGILVTLVATNVIPMLVQSKQTAAKTEIQVWKHAITQYLTLNNRLPDSLDVLTQPDPKYNDEPYLDKEPIDPWGNRYDYKRISGSKFEIISYGADGLPQGDGENEDISSNKLTGQDK